MLILTSVVDDQVVLFTSDGPITVQLMETRPNKARIGFEAPGSVKIMRKEVLEKQAAKDEQADA